MNHSKKLTETISLDGPNVIYEMGDGNRLVAHISDCIDSVRLPCGTTLGLADRLLIVRPPNSEAKHFRYLERLGWGQTNSAESDPSDTEAHGLTSLATPAGASYKEFPIPMKDCDGRYALRLDKCDLPLGITLHTSGTITWPGGQALPEEESEFDLGEIQGNKTIDAERGFSYLFLKKNGEPNRYIYRCDIQEDGRGKWFQLTLEPTSVLPTRRTERTRMQKNIAAAVAVAKALALVALALFLCVLVMRFGHETSQLAALALIGAIFWGPILLSISFDWFVGDRLRSLEKFEGTTIEFGPFVAKRNGIKHKESRRRVPIQAGFETTIDGYKFTGLGNKVVKVNYGCAEVKVKFRPHSAILFDQKLNGIPEGLKASYSKRDPFCVFDASWPEAHVVYSPKQLYCGYPLLGPRDDMPQFSNTIESLGVTFDCFGNVCFGDIFSGRDEVFSQTRYGDYLVTKSNLHHPNNLSCIRIVEDTGSTCLFYAYRAQKQNQYSSWWQYFLVAGEPFGDE